MPKTSPRPKKKVVKRHPARRQQKLSAKEIAKYNARVAAKRREKLKELRCLLRDKKLGPILLDPETRGVAKKFARLPFGCITDSCAGHFLETPIVGNRVSLEKMKLNQRVYASGADFGIILDLSPPAMEFREALKAFDKRFSFNPVLWMGSLVEVHVPISLGKKFGRRQAAEIRKLNLKFLEEFEKLVDSFVKKYGVKVRL